MTDADQQQIDRIERERRRREAEWLLLMLLMVGDSRRRAVNTVTLGHADPIGAARVAWAGSEALEHEGAAPVIAEQMAHAEIEGARRAFRLAGVKPPPVDEATFDRIAAAHAAEAREMAERTWAVIEQKLAPALQGTAGQGIDATVKAIRVAFKEAGVTRKDPSTLAKGIERQVVEKYNHGLWKGSREIVDPKHHLVGFEHVSIVDASTTTICRQRNGLRLPPDHPYWRTGGFPPLHWNCRSLLKSLWGSTLTNESATLPTEPPAPGFGFAPSVDLGSYFGVTR